MMVPIEREKAEAILAYLMTRPFGEVEQAVAWIRMGIAHAEANAADERVRASSLNGRKQEG